MVSEKVYHVGLLYPSTIRVGLLETNKDSMSISVSYGSFKLKAKSWKIHRFLSLMGKTWLMGNHNEKIVMFSRYMWSSREWIPRTS